MDKFEPLVARQAIAGPPAVLVVEIHAAGVAVDGRIALSLTVSGVEVEPMFLRCLPCDRDQDDEHQRNGLRVNH